MDGGCPVGSERRGNRYEGRLGWWWTRKSGCEGVWGEEWAIGAIRGRWRWDGWKDLRGDVVRDGFGGICFR